MTELSNYKQLNREQKINSTKYFVGFVMHELKTYSASGIYEALALKHEEHEVKDFKYMPKKSSGYWEKKLRTGEPIRSHRILETLDSLLPGSIQHLNHSFWSILDNEISSQKESLNCFNELNHRLKSIIFKPSKTAYCLERKRIFLTKQIQAIANDNSLDSLVCLTLLIKERKHTPKNYLTDSLIQEATMLFFRLVTFSPLKVIGIELLMKYHSLFYCYFKKSFIYLLKNEFVPVLREYSNILCSSEIKILKNTNLDQIYKRIVFNNEYICFTTKFYGLIKESERLDFLSYAWHIGSEEMMRKINAFELFINKINRVFESNHLSFEVISKKRKRDGVHTLKQNYAHWEKCFCEIEAISI